MKKVYPCRIPVIEEDYVQYLPFEEFQNRVETDNNRSKGEIIDFFKARKRLDRQSCQRKLSDSLPLLIS